MTNKKIKVLIQMAILLSLLIVSAKLVIPLPFLDYLSLQIVVVYLCYPLLGLRRAVLVLILYLIMGLLGLPVFANGGGVMYVFKPSFGFLVAYIGLPFIQQMAYGYKDRMTWKRCFIGNYIGLIMIHLVGFSYKIIILKMFIQTENLFLTSSLLISSLLDFCFDCLCVFVATILISKLRRNLYIFS